MNKRRLRAWLPGVLPIPEKQPERPLVAIQLLPRQAEIAEAIVGAFATRPVEVISPKLMGRVHQVDGVFPSFMHDVIPRTEARARRHKVQLQRP